MTSVASLAPLASLTDGELFILVQQLTARSNVALADLLAHLGEVERRGIHRERSCASLYAYCVHELRMSEDAAFRRCKAARLVREYPELRERIAKGQLHLTGVLLLGPHLGGERHAEILERARFRTKRELARLIAEIDPKPGVPALVEPIGPAAAGHATYSAFVASLAGPVRELPSGRRPEDWIGENAPSEGDHARFLSELAAGTVGDGLSSESAQATETAPPLRYRVQFTASQEFVDLLDEARDLLGHASARDLPAVQVRALRALVRELRASRRAAPAPARESRDVETASASVEAAPARAPVPDVEGALARRPRGARDVGARRPASRHIPALVRRAVYDRDAARCAYCDARGVRCRETFGLEVHHRHAHALGGPPTLENLELRCRAHNTLAAEKDFGREYVDFMRGVQGGPAD